MSPEKARFDSMVYPRKTSSHVGLKRIKFTRLNLIFVPFEIPFTLVWSQLKTKTIYQTLIRMLEKLIFVHKGVKDKEIKQMCIGCE